MRSVLVLVKRVLYSIQSTLLHAKVKFNSVGVGRELVTRTWSNGYILIVHRTAAAPNLSSVADTTGDKI